MKTLSVSLPPIPKITVRLFGTEEHYVLHADSPCPKGFDVDWTDSKDDAVWRALNKKRNDIVREALLTRNPVQYVSTGNSLKPLICSNDTCFVWPIDENITIRAGDIVFCHVQPGWRYYTHMVWNIYDYTDNDGVNRTCYIIGNNKQGDQARSNGWCHRAHIYGIVVKTMEKHGGATKVIKGSVNIG